MSGMVQGTGITVVGETHVASCLYGNEFNLNTFLEVGE